MEVCVKHENFESQFESERSKFSVPWEVMGPWVQTGGKVGSDKLQTELIIPLTKNSANFNQQHFDYDHDRAKREFVPDEKKDVSYWNKRIKNNASARRSRLKKKCIERNMEAKLEELQRENIELKYELAALKRHFADQLETKHDDISSEERSELSMRSGSGSDTSDSCSVNSEGEGCNVTYETDRLTNSNLSRFGLQQSNLAPSMFPYNLTIPINYSFMKNSVTDRGSNSVSGDIDTDVRAKLPLKFRHKKDFQSAFYVHPYAE